MLSVQTRSLHSATADELWFSPSIKHTIPFSSDNVGSDTNAAAATCDRGDEDSMATVAMPPLHDQLLSGDCASSEALKGYDHTRFSVNNSSSLWWELSAEMQLWLLDSSGEDITPGLVRVPSCLSLESNNSGTSASPDDSVGEPSKARGVTFAPTVTIQPIPHSSELRASQRGRMYATSSEVRRNGARNEKEIQYDGCNWKAATEEPDMDVHAITGEEVHPAHGHWA